MTPLQEMVVDSKCRKGRSAGITKHGAYWMPLRPQLVRSYGGNGIGHNEADCRHALELRHYRSGMVEAVIHVHRWHQSGANPQDCYSSVADLLACETTGAVITVLVGSNVKIGWYGEQPAYDDAYKDELIEWMLCLGLPPSIASPDGA